MDDLKLKDLQDFLDTAQIPESKSRSKTFLGIAKQPHYENVISNIYAFFLDPLEEHKLGDLFINSLVQCLNKKHGTEWIEDFVDFEIYTEYSTDEGRIDVLLINDDSAIIIENKIYHHLNNDLDEYSNYIKNKINKKDRVYGLVLGLKEIKTKEKNFVSLTHEEYLQEVFANLGDYLLEASEKYIPFLKDFYQNIINLSKKEMNEKDLAFYLKNQEKIGSLVQLKTQFKQYVTEEVKKVGSSFDDLELERVRANSEMDNKGRRFNSKIVPRLCIKVGFSHLFTEKQQIKLYIEVRGSTLKKVKEHYSKIIEGLPNSFQLNHGIKNTSKVWYNLSEYCIELDEYDVSDLSNIIIEKINYLDIYKSFKLIEKKLDLLMPAKDKSQ